METYWIGTRNGGLNKFNYNKKKFTAYIHDPSNPNSLISNSVLCLMGDKEGIIWIGTFSNGLMHLILKKVPLNITSIIRLILHSLTDNRIYSLIEDKDGNIWIGTYGGGLNILNRKSGKIFHYQIKK